MCSLRQLVLVSFLFSALHGLTAQSVSRFPLPDALLADAKHKEPKSGVQLGPGNTLTIQQGVGTPTVINVVAFSRDSRFLAAGKDFGRVAVWSVGERKFLCAVDTGQGIVHAVALSADGKLMVTGGEGDDFRLKLWHLPDGKLLRIYDHFDGYIHAAAFSPDSAWVIVSDNNATTHVLDVPTGKRLLELKEMYAPVLSPDGVIMMTVNKESFILWNTTNWTKLRTMPRSPAYAIPLAIDLVNNAFLVTASGTFRMLKLSDGEMLPAPSIPELPKFNAAAGGFASFNSEGSLLYGHSDDRLWVWNIKTGQVCASDLMYSESGSLSADGTLLAGAKDNSILAQSRSGEGVWIWDTSNLVQSCFGAH